MNLGARILNRLAFLIPGGRTVRPWLHRRRGVRIGKNVWIGQYVYIDELHPSAVTIGDNSTIGLRTSIFAHFYWGRRKSEGRFGEVVIGKNVYLGPHCVVLQGVTIGEGSVIKAGSVITKNVPPKTFWGSPPSGPLGRATIPLTAETGYEAFLSGLKPVRKDPPFKSD